MASKRKIMRKLERERRQSFHQIAMGKPRVGQRLSFVVPSELAIAHQHLTVDDDRLHVAGLGAMDELAKDIVYRLIMDRVHVNQNQIRPFTDFNGSAKRRQS